MTENSVRPVPALLVRPANQMLGALLESRIGTRKRLFLPASLVLDWGFGVAVFTERGSEQKGR